MGIYDQLLKADDNKKPSAPLSSTSEDAPVIEAKKVKNRVKRVVGERSKRGKGVRKLRTISQPRQTISSERDSMIPRHHDTTTPRYDDELIEIIRKAAKQIGKEAATSRITPEEKKAVNDIVYTYRTQYNIKTSGNELSRIALNFLLEDYHQNGKESVLAKVLDKLNQ